METSEGVFLYVMTYLFPFEYLEDDVIQQDLSINQTVSLWQENILKYCDSTLEILEQVNTKIDSDGRTKAWTRDRLYFLNKRIIEYNSSIKDLAVQLRINTQDSSFEDITEGLAET